MLVDRLENTDVVGCAINGSFLQTLLLRAAQNRNLAFVDAFERRHLACQLHAWRCAKRAKKRDLQSIKVQKGSCIVKSQAFLVEKRSCSNKFIETRNDGDRCVHTKLALALYSLLWTERTTRGKLHIDRFGLYFTTAWQRSINAIIEYAAFLIWLSVLRAELPYDGGCSNIPKPKSFRGASVAVIPPSVERADLIVH